MKHWKTLFVAASLLLATGPLAAHEHDSEDQAQTGFSGMVEAGGQWMNISSHTHTDKKNRTIRALTDHPQDVNQMEPLMLLDLRYTFADQTQLRLGYVWEEEEPTLTLGLARPISEKSRLAFALLYFEPRDVWKDPYLTDRPKEESHADKYGVKLQYENILDSHFSCSYRFLIKDVTEDQIGQRISGLKRDGRVHTAELAYSLELGRDQLLRPFIEVTRADMAGGMNRYHGLRGGLAYIKNLEPFEFQLMAAAGGNRYDHTHVLFTKKREEHTLSAMAMAFWNGPLGLRNSFVHLGAGLEKTNANIDFYDEDAYFSFMGLGYRF